MITEELSKKSAKLIDDYINGRQQLSFPIYQKLRKQLNLCIGELENLVWNRTCDPSQYDKLAKRLKDYEKMEKEMIKVFKFYKELNDDNSRKEFYKVGTQDQEELPIMKMKLIKITKKDSKKADADADSIISACTKNAVSAEQQLSQLKKTFHKDAIAVTSILKSADSFDDRKYKNMRGTISEVRFQCQELLDIINNYEKDIDKAYRENIKRAE